LFHKQEIGGDYSMRISEEKDKYLKYYLDTIIFQDKLIISAIKRLAEKKVQGDEYVSCSYDSLDEDYKDSCVLLSFWKPAADEDTIVYVENSMFYRYLLKVCEAHMAKYPEDREYLLKYLPQIKVQLNI
jgi:hypothetical protein